MDQKKIVLAIGICGVLTIVGVFLPWYSLSFDMPPGMEGPTGRSFRGTQAGYSGTMILLLAVVGGASAVLIWKGPPPGFPVRAYPLSIVSVAAFALAALATLVDLLGHGPGSVKIGRETLFGGGNGIGLFLTLAATATGGWFAWMLFQKTPAPPPAAPPAPPDNPPPPPPPPPPPSPYRPRAR